MNSMPGLRHARLLQAFVAVIAILPAWGGPAFADAASNHIKSVTAITQVFGEGQKFTAVAVEYDRDIDSARLTNTTFNVVGRTVVNVYANNAAAPAQQGRNGKYVIVELARDDADAALYILNRREIIRKKPEASITQTGAVFTTNRLSYDADAQGLAISRVVNLVVDDFKQLEYKDANSGEVLRYNLFVPRNYDRRKTYPLVLFMHDAGMTSTVTDTTLVQGNGAVIWATPEEQAKRAAFVLAPQYPSQPSTHQGPWPYLQLTVDLVNQIAREYSIDRNRMYTTGQSLGGSVSMQIGLKYPDLFAATYIVASQRDAEETRPLAKAKLWIVVSEGDERAFPGENAMTAVWEQQGARVSRATWDGRATPAEFAANVQNMEAEGNPIKYTVLRRGTVVPPGQPDNGGSNHINTWRIAYSIEGIRDWLFKQHK